MPRIQDPTATRDGDYTFDPSRGRKLKYHGAYEKNPEFDSRNADPQVVSLASTYGGDAPITKEARSVNHDLVSDPAAQEELLQMGGINDSALLEEGGSMTPNVQLSGHMRQASIEAAGEPEPPFRRDAMEHRAVINPTDLRNPGEATGFSSATDRYEDGSPGGGFSEEPAPDSRYPERRTIPAGREGEPSPSPDSRLGINFEDWMVVVQNRLGKRGLEAMASRNYEAFKDLFARGFTVAQAVQTAVESSSTRQAALPDRATLQKQAAYYLRVAEECHQRGLGGKAALAERRAERIISTLEGMDRESSEPAPSRPMPRRAGFMGHEEDLPEDDFTVSTGIGEYQR